MSWSKSASGTADAIREQVSHWPEQIKLDDAAATHLTDACKKGHAAQATIVVAAVDLILSEYPENILSVSGYGHAQDDGAGNAGVSYTLLKAGDTRPE